MNNRINWLLILQGWAMLWVVIGHAPLGEPGGGPAWENVLYNFAYSFHMALFMLVSGWLFYLTRLKSYMSNGERTWDYKMIIKDKAIRLIIPGLFFSIIALILKAVFPGEMTREVSLNFHDIINTYLYPDTNPLAEIWFVITLFWFFLLTPIWKIGLNKKWTMWVSMGIILIIHFYHPKSDFLCLEHVFDYAIWFYSGLVISKTDLATRLFGVYSGMSILAGFLLLIVGNHFHPFVSTVGGIILSFGIAFILDRYIPRAFYTFRNYTYQIFLMGIFAQILIKILFKHSELPYIPAYLLCIAAGLYVPVIVSKIVEWLDWKPLLLCFGLKKTNK